MDLVGKRGKKVEVMTWTDFQMLTLQAAASILSSDSSFSIFVPFNSYYLIKTYLNYRLNSIG